jgi:hypothetical protein
MKKIFILTILFIVLSGSSSVVAVAVKHVQISAEALYQELHLADFNLDKAALDNAVKGYEKLLQQGKVENPRYLTVVDFTQSSDQKRFYLIDLEAKELVVNTYVMHGKNSGRETADTFSNRMNSMQSSLGFYVTGNTYQGKRGYSLRLQGQENEFNSNAEKRGVVVHGSKYINEERAEIGKVSNSEGCPALPTEDHEKVIDLIKDGSVLFIYYPSEEYLEHSYFLND